MNIPCAVAALSILFSCAVPAAAAGGGETIHAGSKTSHTGWLGVSIEDMTARRARVLGVKTGEGALVSDVVDDSPADKAGIRNEDIIVGFDGKTIEDASDLTNAVRASSPGSTAKVVIARSDEQKTLEVTVGEAPRRRVAVTVPHIPYTHRPMIDAVTLSRRAMLGLHVQKLNPQLGEYFGAPGNKGVLVSEVEEDSKAEKAGFRAGDVITAVGKKTVEDVDDIRRALRSYDDGEKVDFEVLRKGSKQTLGVEIAGFDDPGSSGFRFDHDFDFDMPDMDFDMPDIDFDLDVDGIGTTGQQMRGHSRI